MQKSFVQIPSIPTHEINRLGEVRRIADKKKCHQRVKVNVDDSSSTYVSYQTAPKEKHRSKTLNVLLFEVFGKGAASAVGLREPKRITPEYTSHNESLYMRKCAKCGKPTTNYRCSKCWSEIRSQHDCS